MPEPTQPSKLRRSHWPWAFALVLGVLVLTCGGVTVYVLRGMFGFADRAANLPERMGKGIADSFKPEMVYTTQINGAIGVIKHTPKLIVNTTEIDVDIQKAQETHWAYVYWGMTVVEVRAHQNKIQYYVPVDTLGTANFSYDATRKILKAHVPLPRLDEEVVEVQSDPSKIDVRIVKGWSHLNSGEQMKDDALRELRAAVIAEGKNEAHQALAEKDARKTFERLLDPVVSALGGDVKVEVEFDSP